MADTPRNEKRPRAAWNDIILKGSSGGTLSMPVLQRLGTINTLTALFERAIKWVPAVTGTLGISAISGWAANATEALSVYAPASWVFGALIGAVLFMIVYYVFASARLKLTRSEFAQRMLEKPLATNPLETIFTRQKIDLNSFKQPVAEMVIGKTFVDCDIYGPANIILNGYTNLNAGKIDLCDFAIVKTNHPIANAIGFENTTFRNCRMYNITFFVPDYLAKTFPPGPNWITPNSP